MPKRNTPFSDRSAAILNEFGNLSADYICFRITLEFCKEHFHSIGHGNIVAVHTGNPIKFAIAQPALQRKSKPLIFLIAYDLKQFGILLLKGLDCLL